MPVREYYQDIKIDEYPALFYTFYRVQVLLGLYQPQRDNDVQLSIQTTNLSWQSWFYSTLPWYIFPVLLLSTMKTSLSLCLVWGLFMTLVSARIIIVGLTDSWEIDSSCEGDKRGIIEEAFADVVEMICKARMDLFTI